MRIIRADGAEAIALALIVALALATPGRAQPSWSRTYGGADYDFGTAARQTADRGYILAGTTWSFAPSTALHN